MLLAAPLTLRASDPSPLAVAERLSATWTNTATDHGLDSIKRGIEQGIHGLFVLGKPTARSRLLKANPTIASLEIVVSAQHIRVNLGHGRNVGAAPLVWTQAQSATGAPIRVRYSVTGEGVLKMEGLGESGTARHTFRTSPDGGRLRHDVKVESSRLPNVVRYALEYRRKP
jgi:hypothetical protein